MPDDDVVTANIVHVILRYLPQPDLIKFCRDNGIHVMAHQPLGGRPVAVVNPNLGRPGPLVDSDVSAERHFSLAWFSLS